MMTPDELNIILPTLPEKPGCYQYFDEDGKVIYVGKAKNLRRRVSSYFYKEHADRKTRILVRQIRSIKYIVVDSEGDALLLENSLIKEYQPRYNVLLKDGKTYPSIVIKREPFPRIFATRDIKKDGSEYFGPYPGALIAKGMLRLVKEIYPIRTCKLDLREEKIRQGRYRVCLQYHIKKCKGPCIGNQTSNEYESNVSEIRDLLRGNLHRLVRMYRDRMQVYSEGLRFEEAQICKERIELLERYEAKHTVVPRNIDNVDVFSYDEDEHTAYINYMHIEHGGINRVYTLEYRKQIEESKEELLAAAITELRQRFESNAHEIVLPFDTGWQTGESITTTIPRRGDKRKLLELSEKNVAQYKLDKLKRAEKLNPEQRALHIVHGIQKDLHLDRPPKHIECFDNSNIQGTSPVAACVVFKMGKPSKKDYRKFHVKTVEGPNDFASMREIISRHYSRLTEEHLPLPDLIVVDGGKGQLSAAYETLDKLGLIGKIPIIGLAERLEEIFFPKDPVPLILDKKSETLKVIQHLRDEAHRFGIGFHRDVRSKKQIQSELDNIKGIGKKTKEDLLRHFKSVKRIRSAEEEELSALIGRNKAKLLYEGLRKK